ncbi:MULTISPECIES: RNA polymerase sigma factor [unclassified Breznakia]|uniref:RNA polymerase sigma factor n=1 Tax=unclassified Breznakia TaxID=2623764 RepID=UPI002476A5BD|nr:MULTISPECIES: RNA polymerase sigma factor [unclassified Breznakia]MDH6367355.1 RNA polymerase sigma factor (sigma-70 family) [Breznakia sp. PH1-1]MDH6404497.1 RNA polymerase sigma factor (sigma-70 family) [Breznakia sp. PF1-11]MDH6412206.1 RNA polymerase sigma factor (sigma-70 family) [Breznakia sp. PFB1-11]MDH6414522.1 RNA polymerase sigma factor (sigma-70 family) [Breznakia sp. PFB1-14]MDH6416870.1 RNA polymerase sigma factor (sigma-70 family) [Breznakia sp. PFB1-4]
MNEKRIIKKIRKGDQESLNQFIEFLYPQVYRFVYRKLQGDAECADITQETFVRFISNITTYKVQEKVIHYLYRIASNLCIDYWRKQERMMFHELEVERIEDTNIQPHESILKKLESEELLKCIAKLPSFQQDVILLRYFEQLNFREIAAVLEVNENTIKSRHKLALHRLEIIMKGDQSNEKRNHNSKRKDARNKDCLH